jgi:Domain of unknown function (DUF4384)
MSVLRGLHKPTEILAIAAAFGAALALGPALADDIPVPADPIAKAAFDALTKNCSRCHQEGRLDPSKAERPKKNFGFILKLDQLAADPHYVLPGNPDGSKIYKQIVDKEMPYDVVYEGASPDISADDIKAISTWIASLGAKSAAACESHKFVQDDDMIAMMAADLDKQIKARKKGTRYLTLTHLRNSCVDDAAMNVYRQGAIKLINSLSHSSDVVRLEAIDPDQTILRINLDDLGWDAKDWDTILAVYPYNVQPENDLISVLENTTGTKLPYVRADWFAYVGPRPVGANPPGLYDKLVNLPKTFAALQSGQGVDVTGDITRLTAQRAGFQKSGVSRNNRMIERHASKSGYFWTSYDFAGNKAHQSLFESPLGPGGDFGFIQDGGESIFSLPNGFQAYFLNNAKGDSLSNGPTNIVQDPTSKDLTVTNGISCMGCHDQGMRKAKDEIRASVLGGKVFPHNVKEQVDALYPPNDKMDTVIAGDAGRFADALHRAGLEPTLKLNGVEMITALSKHYENDIDLLQAAAELGMSKEQFADSSRDADKKFRPLIRRLEQGSLPRDQFELNFTALADNITDEQIVDVGGGKQAQAAKQVAQVAAHAAHTSDISLTSDKNGYNQNETATFTVLSSRDCFLQVTDIDDHGEGTVLFPNKFVQDNRIRANVEVQLPPPGAAFQYRLKDKGTETVTAVCSDHKADIDGIKPDFNKAAFTSVPNYAAQVAHTRSIAVEAAAAPGQAPAQVQAPKPPDAVRELFRTAIKIGVQ